MLNVCNLDLPCSSQHPLKGFTVSIALERESDFEVICVFLVIQLKYGISVIN